MMRYPHIIRRFSEHFALKFLAVFYSFFILLSSAFIIFFIHHQTRALTDTLINEGEVLTGLLAYNSRLGVFSENEALLRDPIEGILQREEVISVSVFNQDGTLLLKGEKGGKVFREAVYGKEQNILRIMKASHNIRSPFHVETPDQFEFWAPVVSRKSPTTEDFLYFEETSKETESHVIGTVKVILSKVILHERYKSLLFKGFLIGIVFLLFGSVVTYLAVRRITGPLKRLTATVKAFGMGKPVEEVSVETEDEIGKFALAFNTMTESLSKKEREKRQLEEQLRQAQKMEAIGTLAGGIAHDFNNILMVIIGYGDLLLMKLEKNETVRKYMEQILAAAKRAANLTQSLLAFSRKQIIDPRPLNLNEVILNVEKMLSRLIGEDIEFRVDLAHGAMMVMADVGQMEQILINLAANARDAMPDGGVLTISTAPIDLDGSFFRGHDVKKPGRYVLLSVADTGSGIDEKTRERIFEPFFTTKEIGKGTGLGLSIVYGIVKQHDGVIDVWSKTGKGTIFRIYLPMIVADTKGIDTEAHKLVRGGTETVLIAEDDVEVRSLSREILERYGYRVIDAIDGEDAVDKFMKHEKDIEIILLDMVMPKKNGREVLEEIRKIRPDVKALFISGYAPHSMHQKGILEDGIQFISKPISVDDLLKKVREMLDHQAGS
jgi:signal transduction histidine kinase/ActR/RegA family two-component response regulator